MNRMHRTKKTSVLAFLTLLILLFVSLYLPFPRSKLSPAPVLSLSILDRNNILLREVLSDEGGRCRWLDLKEVSPFLLKATVVAEDRHFFLHPGVNLLAITRALIQNIKHKRIISGASTISQQLVRNITHKPRTIFSKLLEAWLALRLERTMDKEEILAQYLNRICYGNQAYGAAAASRLYFDKPASDLSLAEAAFLAALPRSPANLNPYRSFPQAKKRQSDILYQMYRQGYIAADEWQRAQLEPLNLCTEKQKFRAPHFCDYILQQVPPAERRRLSRIQTTCDYVLQEKVETLLRNHIESLRDRGISNAAAVILENATTEILCMVGSKDFFDNQHDGQVNGALSLRQPGSTLKPFTYGLALERGMTTAEILEDRDIHFHTPEGSYKPRNYDQRFHGPVRLRQALANSYNVPAVSLLQRLGPDLLFNRLKKAGFDSLQKSPSHYGIGLTLGNGEVTLLELVRAYSALAQGGVYRKERSIQKCFDSNKAEVFWEKTRQRKRIFPALVACILTDILSDNDARVPAFGYTSPLSLPFDCAAKTGTTKDFRDNWTIGYTPKYTVGVWVGNFDGSPMFNVSGVTGCGPLFKDIMLLLDKRTPRTAFAKQDDLIIRRICPLSGKLASESCPGSMEDLFIKGTEPQEVCGLHQENRQKKEPPTTWKVRFSVSFPLDGDIFKIDPVLRKEFQRIKFTVFVPHGLEVDTVEWWINGRKIGQAGYPFALFWDLKPGEYIIKALASVGKNKIGSLPVRLRVIS
jgi:penicillin-binding protein 1C